MAGKALFGLKIIEWADMVSGPFCTKVMANLGAEVIKIEQPGFGDEARRYGPFLDDIPDPEKSGLFLFLNTNKLGITLDLKTSIGRNIFNRLLSQADVFVENHHPKVATDLELDYEHLADINRRIIVTSVTPLGKTGTYKEYKAYDINCCAAGGASVLNGHTDREPLTLPLSSGAYEAGISAAVGTIFALLAREMTGEGQQVDVSEANVLSNLFGGRPGQDSQGASSMKPGMIRGGALHYPMRVLPCKDGQMSLVAPQLQQWIRFVDLMGNPEWSRNPRYRDRRAMGAEYPEEVDNLITPWLKEHTKDDLFSLCRRDHIPFAPIRTVDELFNDPHLHAREFFLEVNHPKAGRLEYPGAPFKLSKTPWAIEHSAPLLGEHNEEIFIRRLGYTKEDLITLKEQGVI